MTKTMIEKKILGCLYGQAIGDAMGMPSELWTQNKVRQFFGEINDFLPGPEENIAASMFKKGQFTDDTQQAIALIKAIIASEGRVIPEVVAQHILAWAESINAFNLNILGPTSKSALLAIKNGTPLDEISANGVTNGSAMRISPIGCLLPTNNMELFIQGVRNACLPTHKSDIAIAGAAVVAWSISRAIEGAPWHTIKQELPKLAHRVQTDYESTFSPSLARRIEFAFQCAQQLKDQPKDTILYELYQLIGAGMDIIETIPTALAIVDITECDAMLTAHYCANLGGDTDTIGAIATAISGTIQGIDTLPTSAIELINTANHINFNDMASALAQYRLNIRTE